MGEELTEMEMIHEIGALKNSVAYWEARYQEVNERRIEEARRAALMVGQNNAAMYLILRELDIEFDGESSHDLLSLVTLLIRKDRRNG